MQDTLSAILAKFGEKDGELVVAGRKVSEIAAEHGTPLYIYDRSKLVERHRKLREALPAELAITYAVKANPNIEVLRTLGPLYDGIDVASQGEIEKSLEAGVPASKMSFAGPGKTPAELRFAVGRGLGSISVEGERELEHIRAICAETGREAGVMIRINPAFELSRAGLKMGGGSKQFGIDSERVPAVIRSLRGQDRVRFRGIHIFSGTQNLSSESILETCGKIMEYAASLSEETGEPLEYLNMGGGFGIPYFKGDGELDLAQVGAGMGELIRRFRPRLPKTRFKIELGRYIVGESGVYVARVVYRKESRGSIFLVMDGGMHHHLPASGNINQSPIRRHMNLTVANRLHAAKDKASVVGPLCTPLDNFGLNIELPKADEGDLIAVFNSGAYGLSISPVGFLSHKAPREIMI